MHIEDLHMDINGINVLIRFTYGGIMIDWKIYVYAYLNLSIYLTGTSSINVQGPTHMHIYAYMHIDLRNMASFTVCVHSDNNDRHYWEMTLIRSIIGCPSLAGMKITILNVNMSYTSHRDDSSLDC